MASIEFDSKNGGITFDKGNGNVDFLIRNGKISNSLLDIFVSNHIEYDDIVGKKVKEVLSTKNPGFYLIDESSIKNNKSGNADAEKGLYLVLDDGNVLNLGNNFLE